MVLVTIVVARYHLQTSSYFLSARVRRRGSRGILIALERFLHDLAIPIRGFTTLKFCLKIEATLRIESIPGTSSASTLACTFPHILRKQDDDSSNITSLQNGCDSP